MGYGWCIVASLLAHLYLVKTAFGKTADDLLPYIKTIALIALLFTAVGTILGGIWADQSWGRFWGWDPKENGALLIVLWLLWALHARISGNLKRIPYVTAIAALSVIVALAWFGVNLLSVGLHSYGFISGVAAALFAFVAAEAILLGALYYRISVLRKQRTP
jgi:ABC-type transport system involved in cytochrome c biogenesis permease subunit